MISHVPFAGHTATKDTTLQGYKIPKGTNILILFWSLHHNEKIFPDPYAFKPQRFLDESGQLLPPGHLHRKAVLPFGAGRRVCLGETMARNRLFLAIAALVQRYKFLPENGKDNKPIDVRNYHFGIVLNPGKVTVKVIKRD